MTGFAKLQKRSCAFQSDDRRTTASQADNEQSKQTGQEYIDSILLNASPQELYTISYSFGHGLRLTKNPEKARYWAKAAADKGSVNGTYYLGELYWNAKEVPEALKCFEKAAEMGLTAAELQTGRIYLYGADGVPKNPAKAVYWMKKAAPIASNEDLLTLVGLELSDLVRLKTMRTLRSILTCTSLGLNRKSWKKTLRNIGMASVSAKTSISAEPWL